MSKKQSSKVYPDAKSALGDVLKDGMTVMSGGFGACGVPENLIAAVHDLGMRGLTVVSNNAGLDGFGLTEERLESALIAPFYFLIEATAVESRPDEQLSFFSMFVFVVSSTTRPECNNIVALKIKSPP